METGIGYAGVRITCNEFTLPQSPDIFGSSSDDQLQHSIQLRQPQVSGANSRGTKVVMQNLFPKCLTMGGNATSGSRVHETVGGER